ncbi:MAG: tetratricopeptide repeat protein [Cyanobacteria bacterium J06554_1]
MNIWVKNIYFLQLGSEDNPDIGQRLKWIFFEGIFNPLSQHPTIAVFVLLSFVTFAIACIDRFKLDEQEISISPFGKRATPLISLIFLGIALFLYGHGIMTEGLDTQGNNIGRLYFLGSQEEDLGEIDKAQKYYERAIKLSVKRINSDSTEGLESAMRYAEAKAAYRLGNVLYKEKKYVRSAENFLKAYTRYIEHQEYFDSPPDSTSPKNEQVSGAEINFPRLDHDSRFNHSKAYHSLFMVGMARYDYANTLNLRRRKKKEELSKSVKAYEQVLEEENTKDDAFRSLVWLRLSEAYSKSNNNKEAILCLFRAYLVKPTNEEIIQRLKGKELLKESGGLKLSDTNLKDIYDMDDLSVFIADDPRNSIGGPEPLNEVKSNEGGSQGEEVNNPFTSTLFPQVSCGDDRPSDPSLYPIKMYPIYIDDTDENLQRVRGEFCNDAFVNKQAGQIQVASFHKRDLGHYFHILMEQEFGNAYTGAASVYSSPTDTDPETLTD